MSGQDTIAVIGAGIVGTAVALALAREGRSVLLLDRADPGIAGASFGNVGHIAAELVRPLPSPGLLLGFWRELYCFGGALDLPAAQALRMLPWIGRFAAAAFRRDANTLQLAPLVKPAAATWGRWLAEIGRPDLLRRNGHYEIGFGRRARPLARAQARTMARLGIGTRHVEPERLLPLQRAAHEESAAGLWFEDSAHVLDPLEAVRAFAAAALERGARFRLFDVRALRSAGDAIELAGDQPPLRAARVVVCAGMGSRSLLASFGLHAPLQAVRGYHVEMPGHGSFLDAPIVYTREHLLVTPMAGRLRASSYMEFTDDPGAPPDPRKLQRLRQKIRALGYACEPEGLGWVGSRPVLPDYLPAIGRAQGPKVYYAAGHQHIGLTIAPITAELVADLVAERRPRLSVRAFDLRRFNGDPSFGCAGSSSAW